MCVCMSYLRLMCRQVWWATILTSLPDRTILVSAPKTLQSSIYEVVKPPHLVTTQQKSPYILHKLDFRLQRIQFMVNKPSFEECKRVFQICTTVSFTMAAASGGYEHTGDEHTGVVNTIAPAPALTTTLSNSTITPLTQTLDLDHPALFVTLLCAVETGDVKQLEAVLGATAGLAEKADAEEVVNGTIDPEGFASILQVINMPLSLKSCATLLHVASSGGGGLGLGLEESQQLHTADQLVYLLLLFGADPNRRDASGALPYQVACGKHVRDAFRKARGVCEGRHCSSSSAAGGVDWVSSGVPAAITNDTDALKKQKEKEKKRRAKQRKQQEKQVQAAQATLQAEQVVQQKAVDAQLLVERQQAAGQCAFCQLSLFNIRKVLDVFDRRCCSSECVTKLRRVRAAEAAEARFKG